MASEIETLFREPTQDHKITPTFVKRSWTHVFQKPGHSMGLGMKVVLQGREGYRLHGRHRWVHAGEVLLLNAGDVFEYDFDGDYALGWCLQLDPRWLAAFRAHPEDLHLEGHKEATLEMAGGIYQLPPELIQQFTAWNARVWDSSTVYLEMARLFHEVDGPRARWYPRINSRRYATRQWVAEVLSNARQYLHDQAYGPPVSLHELASHAGMSPYHLHRHFRRAFGLTPQQYQQQLQLARVADGLSKSSNSIQEIALEAGFTDPHYFSRLFKKQTGLRPSHYRALGKDAPKLLPPFV